ncbi:unnamed protein product, partial [Ectocarpus sp. 12 AP-2014]
MASDRDMREDGRLPRLTTVPPGIESMCRSPDNIYMYNARVHAASMMLTGAPKDFH